MIVDDVRDNPRHEIVVRIQSLLRQVSVAKKSIDNPLLHGGGPTIILQNKYHFCVNKNAL